jgi:3-phenylpropionate/trans-cinnamate dioxygenase ferredoxin reductase subunit
MQIAGAPETWDQLVYRGDPSSGSFMAFQLSNDKILSAIGINAARDMRFARALIAAGKIVDRQLLTDSKYKLQDFAR